MNRVSIIFAVAAVALLSSEAVSSAQRTKNSCYVFYALPRTCTAARLVVKMYGRASAETRARACGATDEDIAQARECLRQHGEDR